METKKIEATTNSTATKPIYRSPIGMIFNKFAKQKDVSLVYGEPIELENKKVLPVAKVDYYVGGGGGYSGGSENSPVAQGEGGGGFISVKPLGVYEISSDKVKFKPAIDLKFILMIITVCTFGFAILMMKPFNNR
ncbi:glycine-rich protein [Sporosarcina jiandibaonis]|uniref:glycine-rich protein n=1 Tax=Sporosarcina jiandibaonis TaxID=2715535 RepID=UPI0015571A8E|nr:glycine-rich protein [Sporosarcina jiandibaonis]